MSKFRVNRCNDLDRPRTWFQYLSFGLKGHKPSMAASHLSVEILLEICECLGQSHPASIKYFALVCKQWAAVASKFQYRSISIQLTSGHGLKRHVEKCAKALKNTDGFKHVKRLEVTALPRAPNEVYPKERRRTWRRAPYEDFGESLYNSVEPNISHSMEVKLWAQRGLTFILSEELWQPVVELIHQLPVLADLIWNCFQPVPVCILDALHRYRPSCRLWVNIFRWRSHKTAVPTEAEYKLFTAPCLYAIRVECKDWHPPGHLHPTCTRQTGPYDQEALHCLVASAGTSLRRVVVDNPRGKAMCTRPAQKPFDSPVSAGSLEPRAKGQLESLCLELHRQVTELTIRMWDEDTDLSLLQSLSLPDVCDAACYARLCQCPFRDLHSLALNVPFQRRALDETLDMIQHFLVAIPPLKTLRLMNEVHLLDMIPVIERHGPTLEALWLLQDTWSFQKPKVWQELYLKTAVILASLKNNCPRLERLAIPVRRSKGIGPEIEAYMMLGSNPRLRELNLILDCSDYSVYYDSKDPYNGDESREPSSNPVEEQSWDEFLGQDIYITNKHIEEAIINCFIDARLAREIFTCISNAKQDSDVLLEKLTLQVRDPAVFCLDQSIPLDLHEVLKSLNRD